MYLKNKKGNIVVLNDEFKELQKEWGVKNIDPKKRPHLLAIEDNQNRNLFWLIPIATKSHMSEKRIQNIEKMMEQKRSVKRNYFETATIDKREVYLKISSVLPVTDKYIYHNFTRANIPVKFNQQAKLKIIKNKLLRILSFENRNPDKLEQKITLTKERILAEDTLDS